MADTRSQETGGQESVEQESVGQESVGEETGSGRVRARRGLRITLLSMAAAILLLGAAAACVYGYMAISNARRAARVATIADIARSAPAATVWIGAR
jgi:hypothetical protein